MKIQSTMETYLKPEYNRRMEEQRRLEGKQRMKSNLWKQRREHYGKLVSIWKELKTECETNNRIEAAHEPSSGEGDGKAAVLEDPWLEELSLTEAERTKLMELEQWYLHLYQH